MIKIYNRRFLLLPLSGKVGKGAACENLSYRIHGKRQIDTGAKAFRAFELTVC